MTRKRRSTICGCVVAASLALAGCQATGRAANSYLDWGGRTFTTNPISVFPFFLGFGAFFVAGLPLDLFSWIATAIGWPDGRGEDYQGSALSPSIFLGTTGGTLLGAPFFPFGLPWWNPEREDADAPAPRKPPPGEPPPKAPSPVAPPEEPPARAPRARAEDPSDPDSLPAAAPRR